LIKLGTDGAFIGTVDDSDPPLLSPVASIGFGLIFVVVGGMLLGVGLSQWRGGGHAVFASRAARVVFGQEYGPSWFRTTRWPHFDYGMRIICGTGFILVGLLAIVSVIFRL